VAGPRDIHDPGTIVVDLAAGLALGGDCLAGIVVLREEHRVRDNFVGEQDRLAGVADQAGIVWL